VAVDAGVAGEDGALGLLAAGAQAAGGVRDIETDG
jgi:hypothetical protein